jgi:hypothetical protein
LNLRTILGPNVEQERPTCDQEILDIQNEIADGIRDPTTGKMRSLDSDQSKIWKLFLKARSEWDSKCLSAMMLLSSSFSSTIWNEAARELNIDLLKEIHTDGEIRRMLNQIRKTYGAFSANVHERNLNDCYELPKFTTVNITMKALDSLRYLLSERESWTERDARGNVVRSYEMPEADLQLWIYRRMNTSLFERSISDFRKRGLTFLQICKELEIEMREIRRREDLDNSPRFSTMKTSRSEEVIVMSAISGSSVEPDRKMAMVGRDNIKDIKRCYVCNDLHHLAPECPIARRQGYDGTRPFHPDEQQRGPRPITRKLDTKTGNGQRKFENSSSKKYDKPSYKKPYVKKNHNYKGKTFSNRVNSAQLLEEIDNEESTMIEEFEERLLALKRKREEANAAVHDNACNEDEGNRGCNESYSVSWDNEDLEESSN